MYKTGIRIIEAEIGIETNEKKLLPSFPLKTEVPSLLTDFREVERIPYSDRFDGYVSIEEDENCQPSFEFAEERVKFKGSFIKLSRENSDSRFSFWGNQGFLFRYTLFLLEKKHKIYNIHGCALYQEGNNRFFLIAGRAGSGKTVFILSGLEKGLKLFSTETVHFRLEKDGIKWFIGSLIDNIRVETLRYNFPGFLRGIDSGKTENDWQKKVALDLTPYKSEKELLLNPDTFIIFPRIEEGRTGFFQKYIADKRTVSRILFNNISQKLSETVILFDKMPLTGLDNEEIARERLKSVEKLVHDESIMKAVSILSNPRECWGSLL